MDITPITVERLRGHINDHATPTDDLQSIVDTANDLVRIYIGETVIPPAVLDQAQLETASKIAARRLAPTGGYDDVTGTPVPAPLDPMVTTYPLLNKYVVRL